MAIEQFSEEAVPTFSDLVKEARESSNDGDGISRNKLAHEVGVDPSYLTRIEHGDREPPRAHVVGALARCLRLDSVKTIIFYFRAGYAPIQIQTLSESRLKTVSQLTELLSKRSLSDAKKDRLEIAVKAVIDLFQEV